MTTDYANCQNVSGTASMCYNAMSQRNWNANIRSKRDKALNTLMDELCTKYAELKWSNATAINLAITNRSADIDVPTGAETESGRNSRPFLTNSIKPTIDGEGEFDNGYGVVYTPPGQNAHFQLVTDGVAVGTGVNAGYECIKYTHPISQLCEVEGSVSVTSGGSQNFHILYVAVFVNTTVDNTRAGDLLPHKFTRTTFINDSESGGECGTTGVYKEKMVLNQGDKVKLVVWKGDTNNSATVLCTSAVLTIKTLP